MAKEIKAKSILHYHKQTFATNWDANIYRGCEHNCQYCFAQYSHKYLDTKDFFNDIYVKSNAPELLIKEFNKKNGTSHPLICVAFLIVINPPKPNVKLCLKYSNHL